MNAMYFLLVSAGSYIVRTAMYTTTSIVPEKNTYLVGNVNYAKFERSMGWIRKQDVRDKKMLNVIKEYEKEMFKKQLEEHESWEVNEEPEDDGTIYACNLNQECIPNNTFSKRNGI